jgi:hypothetical protein
MEVLMDRSGARRRVVPWHVGVWDVMELLHAAAGRVGSVEGGSGGMAIASAAKRSGTRTSPARLQTTRLLALSA